MKRVLLTGGRGMLGRSLCKALNDFEVIATDLPETDITSPEKIAKTLDRYQPDTVIHCAAMTAVDRCETEKELAYLLNCTGSANVADACDARGIRLIGISTDYVFDGDAGRPYRENDPATGGKTVYGQTKFAGEEEIRKRCKNHIITRISWLYGSGGPSFLHTMIQLADGTRPVLKVVDDQRGNPTSTYAVARGLRILLLHPELRGTFHLTCEGEATWYEFAREIFQELQIPQQLQPCSSAEFPRPAPRPADSRLEKYNLRQHALPPMPHWKEALQEFLQLEFPEKFQK